jgi:hypothetical protein
MQAPNGRTGWSIDHRQPIAIGQVNHGNEMLIRFDDRFLSLGQSLGHQAPTGELGILRHHQPACRARRVHPFVVEHDLHLPGCRMVDGSSHELEQSVGHERTIAR